MTEDTIVPEVRLDRLQADIRRAVLKSIADNDVLELVIHVPLSAAVDLNQVLKLRRHGAWMSLSSGQLPLPTKSKGEPVQNHPGQLEAFEVNADAEPDGPVPVKYSLLLLELPTEEKQLKAAKKWLRKQTGLKAADLDLELQGLSPKTPYLVIEGGNEPYVMEKRMEMERLGMVVSTHAWDQAGEISETPAEVAPESGAVAKVTIDQLTVGSQWLLHGIGTQVRIHNIQGEKVYFHSLYALYSSLPAWVFAAAVTPAEPLTDLEAVDLAKWEDAPIKPAQLDPETEARLQEPWLMPVVELPLEAIVEHQGKRRVILSATIGEDGPVVVLGDEANADANKIPVEAFVSLSELVEPIALRELSPLVFHALGAAQLDQAMNEPMTDADWKAAGMPENASGDEETPAEEDPSESTAVSDGGEESASEEVVGTEDETESEPQAGEVISGFSDATDEQEAA
jgi:hypothetical protein